MAGISQSKAKGIASKGIGASSNHSAKGVSASDFQTKLQTMFAPVGDRLVAENVEWIDIGLLDDNPYQPRTRISETAIQERKASMNSVGQLQSIVARPHPTHPGRFQQAFGHVRKMAVRSGANAGIAQPVPTDFIGKLMCEVRSLSDFELMVYGLRENDDAEAVELLDRARSYERLRGLASEALGHRATWADVEKLTGLSYRQMKRVADLLDLPDFVKTKIESGELNERHGRALLQIKGDETAQRQLLREIEKNQLSGGVAERRAMEMKKSNDAKSESSSNDSLSNTGVSSGASQSSTSNSRSSTQSSTRNDSPTAPSQSVEGQSEKDISREINTENNAKMIAQICDDFARAVAQLTAIEDDAQLVRIAAARAHLQALDADLQKHENEILARRENHE